MKITLQEIINKYGNLTMEFMRYHEYLFSFRWYNEDTIVALSIGGVIDIHQLDFDNTQPILLSALLLNCTSEQIPFGIAIDKDGKTWTYNFNAGGRWLL